MKKVFFFISAAAMLLTAACQKETVSSNKDITLTATLEQQDEGKTSLSDGCVLWTENDAINVFTGEGGNFKFDLVDGAGTVVGKFKNDAATGTPAYAIYPYNENNTIEGSTVTFNLPAVQKYVPNSFANNANVSVAAINGSSMAFKNVCGALKLNITGIGMIDSLTVKGNNGEKLWGTFSADAANASPACVAIGSPADEEKVISLVMDEPVLLRNSTPTSFIIVVPVGAFGNEINGGFEVKGYFKTEEVFSFNTTDSRNIINRSSVRAMPTKKVRSSVPSYILPVDYIQSYGNQYINTNLLPEEGLRFEIDMQITNLTDYGRAAIIASYGSSGGPYSIPVGWNNTAPYGEKFWSMYEGWGGEVPMYNVKDIKRHTFWVNTHSQTWQMDDNVIWQNHYTVMYRTINNPFYIFAANYGNGVERKAHAKLFNLIIRNKNDEVLAYYIPCYNKQLEEYGVYDLCGCHFLGNISGNGSFSGPEIDK